MLEALLRGLLDPASLWSPRVLSSPLRVAVFSLDHRPHACGAIRLEAPLRATGTIERQWAVSWKPDGENFDVDLDLDGVDVIVIQRLFPHPVTQEVVERLLAARLPVVYELDDLLTELPAASPHFATSEACRPHVLEAIRRADLVTVSTPALKQEYAALNSNIRVLPNSVEARLFQRLPHHPRRRASGPVTIAYTGTATHLEDLSMIERTLCRVHERYGDRVRFLFMGCATETLAALPGVQLVAAEMDYRRYAVRLAASQIDLAVIPLRDNRFNRCKSNIKWLEYGACGIPGVFSDLRPYRDSITHGATGVLVGEDQDAWLEAISRLVDDPAQRESIASRAHAEVLERYSLEANADLYRQTYEEVAGRRAGTSTPPRCSIIIPVFNQVELTRDCVAALLRTTAERDIEVIFVDNGSSDETPAYLSSLGEPIRVIRNAQNLGFARACNQGARAATHEYLLFLNNDTVPLAGWLMPLLAELDGHPDAGIVGSKLLFADGTIQHAGVAFSLPDGVPYHIYRGMDAHHPAVERRRELRAVTGACMLVRRSLFESLGGFDEGYRNGFEDIDLCLRAVDSGAKVVYQPSSVVVHLEEQSDGRKDHDEENLVRLLRSWAGRSFPDEVGRLLEDGLIVNSAPGGQQRWIEPLPEGPVRKRWERIAEMERRVAASGLQTVTELPPSAEEWPDDSAALRWGELLCTWSALSERAEAFRRRLEAIGGSQAA